MADRQMVAVDVRKNSENRPKVFQMNESDQRAMKELFSKYSAEQKVRACKEIIHRQVNKIDAVDSRELTQYVDLIVDQMAPDALSALEKAPQGFAIRIKTYIEKLMEEHRQRQFQEWLEVGKITCQPMYEFKKRIAPLHSTSTFGGSLYQAEEEVNSMPEHQTIEWKESWHDEFLEWICGYANAYGGTLYIGKNDNGKLVGLSDKDSKKLMESIPNKITDTMGIVADVNLLYEGGLQYIEIIVDKYPSLISYHGKYFYRSGSTMRTINGKELDKAILKSQGRTWDGMPIPKLKVTDLRREAIDLFKEKAVRRNRLTEEETRVDDTILMENLHLFDEEGHLNRAAMLAFYKEPEKWVTGSYIKIGYFGDSDSDLKYQDEVHGALIEQIDKAVDLVYTKYLKALIYYEGIQRIEQFMFPQEAFREILLNAVVHKNYSDCNPIQISVYEDKIYIWNDGEMPSELNSTEKLFEKHSSKPYNPKLANVFFKSGMIEAWGRGFDKIKEACEKYDGRLPEYHISASGIMVLCRACDKYLELLNGNESNSLTPDERVMSELMSGKMKEPVQQILEYLKDHTTITTAMGKKITGKSEAQVRRYLKALTDCGVIKSKNTTKGNRYARH